MFEYLKSAEAARTSVTMVLDKGLGLHALDDLLAAAGDYVQVIKFGWATSVVLDAELLEAKIERIRARGVDVCPGGTFFELAYARGAVDPFLEDARSIGFSCVEVSNGAVEMPLEEKLELIRKARAAGFKVFSEVGKKTLEEDSRLGAAERASLVEQELEAGASKVIMEARESGSLGIFDPQGKVKESIVEALVERVSIEDILFEAPQKSQQVWLMKRFGPAVNLGNVRPEDVVSVETMRQGLRADTAKDFLLHGAQVRMALGVGGALAAAERGDVTVVIDCLRASSTIVTALASGMEAVVPYTSVEECLGEGRITAGERGGKKIPGFAHGNSPLEIRGGGYRGRTLHLTTTNGTECIKAASRGAAAVLVGCLLNARAVARTAHEIARRDGRNITLLMPGRNNREAREDTIGATEIAHYLDECPLLGTMDLYVSTDYVADFLASDTGRNLLDLGSGADVEYCAQKDVCDVVPIYRDGRLLPYDGA